MCQNEEVQRYFAKEPYSDEKQAREDIEWMLKLWREGTGLRWVISLKDGGEFIGEIGFHNYDRKHRKADVSYKLSQEHWRKGYMSEALQAVLEYIFCDTDINRVQALVNTRNLPSDNLLEKHGFVKEGVLRDYEFQKGAYVDLFMFSFLRREWESR